MVDCQQTVHSISFQLSTDKSKPWSLPGPGLYILGSQNTGNQLVFLCVCIAPGVLPLSEGGSHLLLIDQLWRVHSLKRLSSWSCISDSAQPCLAAQVQRGLSWCPIGSANHAAPMSTGKGQWGSKSGDYAFWEGFFMKEKGNPEGRIRIGLKGWGCRDGKCTRLCMGTDRWDVRTHRRTQAFLGRSVELRCGEELWHDMTARESTQGSTQPSSAICHNNISIISSELNTDLIYQIMF